MQKKVLNIQQINRQLLQKLEMIQSSNEILSQQLNILKQKQQSLKSQINNYIIQIQQADNLIKNKNNIILEYQKQVQQFLNKIQILQNKIDSQKISKNQKIKKYQDQIQKLKDKLYSNNDNNSDAFGLKKYSSLSNNRYLTFGTKRPTPLEKNDEIAKIEISLIEQMNQQNVKLRTEVFELTKKINSIESLSRIFELKSPKQQSKNKINNLGPEKDVGSKAQLNIDVEERLLKFNEKLENCIHENELIAERDVGLTASQRIVHYERQRRQIQNKYMKQIHQLKQQITQLKLQSNGRAQPPSMIKVEPQSGLFQSELKQFEKYNIISEQMKKSSQQQIQFLRNKLQDQQKINFTLIALNQHLKKQFQQSLEKNPYSTTQYYKLQWKQAEKLYQEEKQNNKKLMLENQSLKSNQFDPKLVKDYELKFFNLEQQINQLSRENTYLKIAKTKIDHEKANLIHDVNVYSADIESIKSSTQTKLHQYQKIINELKGKCSILEKQLYQSQSSYNFGKSNSKIPILESPGMPNEKTVPFGNSKHSNQK